MKNFLDERILPGFLEGIADVFRETASQIRAHSSSTREPESGAAGRQPAVRAGARKPASIRGRLRTLIMESGDQGITTADLEKALPQVAASSLRSHVSVLTTKLGEAERRGERIFWRHGSRRAAGVFLSNLPTDPNSK